MPYDPEVPQDVTGHPPRQEKHICDSCATMTEIVMPNDTNQLGNLFGGRLLQFMDVCGAIAAQRHSGRVCVTASVDSVEFKSSVFLGEIVNIEARVNRAFTTSMEVEVNVWAEKPGSGRPRRWCNRAYCTYVAVDDNLKPVPIEPIVPQTDEEQKRYSSAARRRELRLVMSGRMELKDAERLKAVFEESRVESRESGVGGRQVRGR